MSLLSNLLSVHLPPAQPAWLWHRAAPSSFLGLFLDGRGEFVFQKLGHTMGDGPSLGWELTQQLLILRSFVRYFTNPPVGMGGTSTETPVTQPRA